MKELSSQFADPAIQKIGWIDIHTHLNFLEITPEQAVADARKMGMDQIITIGTEPADLPIVLQLAEQFSPHVFCTLGIHPHEGKVFDPSVESFLRTHLNNKRVVAVGEIGLDYYYGHSPKEEQIQAFRKQMELAEEFDLPVEIHTRDADDDTIEILKEFKDRVRGVIHCFTGTQKLADAALECGYNISFSGIITFKNAQDLRDVCKTIPLDRMHVETDAPFLAPMPMRGRKNVPEYMLWTAQFVADLKEIDLETFCRQMKVNALAMFPKLRS